MRLKRLELAGFKSFVDPTKIDLGDGITAIVGPNGCGKSNIVDAIRWVLGEHSAKHLRGGVMDDLIFQGSDTRPPVAVCDVELTFAVQQGQLPSPYHELEEIRIRRRLTREGGSDAFINGKMVRIKDIVDLFLDTGISTRAYAIVEQDAISRMITAKPEDRRLLFEEAAGVMKYRSRRREAERKMKDTRQNLERVTDLLEEVRTQCRSLKQQASRAERFKKMQDEFEHLQAISMGLRYRQSQEQYQQVAAELDQAKIAETAAAQALTAAEKDVAQARQALVAHEGNAQAVQDKLRAAEQERADLQRQAERLAGERRLLSERKDSLTQRIEEAKVQLDRLALESAETEKKMASQDDSELKASCREAEQTVEAAEQEHRAGRETRDRLFSEHERLKQAEAHAAERQQQARDALTRLSGRIRQLSTQITDLQQQAHEREEMLKAATDAMGQAESWREQMQKDITEAQQKLDQCRQALETAKQQLSDHEAKASALKGIIQEIEGRLQHQDVPNLLREHLRAKGAIWVDESLVVPAGLELAVAAALRGRSADVRIPVNPDLSVWRDSLNEASEAPIALFAGNNNDSTANSLAAALKMPQDHPLFALFAPVVLVDDICETGDIQAGHCCVSHDGWRREADGWLIPPSQGQTARRLSLQRQLREKQSKLAGAEKELGKARRQFAQAEEALEKQQQLWQQTHLDNTDAEADLRSQKAHLERLQIESGASDERLSQLTIDLQAAQNEQQQWQEELERGSQPNTAEQQQAKHRLDEQAGKLHQHEVSLNQARQQLAHATQAMALFSQTRETMARELERLQQEQQRLQAQIAQDRDRLQETEAAMAQAIRQDSQDVELSQAARSVDTAHQELNALRQHGHSLQQAAHEAERQERQSRQTHQQASEQRQSIEVRQAQEQTRLQDLADEIQQRCQTRADALLKKMEQMEGLEDTEAMLTKVRTLEERLGRFGPVNLLAIEEYDQAAEREQFLATQASDLEASLETLGDTIARIDRTTKQRFHEVFEQTNVIFQKTFPHLFGGGRAELRLDSDDVLTAGVEVIAQPPGKRLQDISLLSGGEKALTAVALVFSIFRIKPAPFCILDEVDAPLDDSNVGRFGDLVKELSDQVQFMAITHNKITMQQADRLVGVSMPEAGVSRIVAVDLDAAEEAVAA
ncbi:MAG: chromosome segregation protein SMC [Mariprofundaceae bacterium]